VHKWAKIHGDTKPSAGGAFRAWTLVPKDKNEILAKMDFEGVTLFIKTLPLVNLSNQYYTATAQLDHLKGRALTEAEKGRKFELEEIVKREKRSQEEQQTKEVVDGLIDGVEVCSDLRICALISRSIFVVEVGAGLYSLILFFNDASLSIATHSQKLPLRNLTSFILLNLIR
jgi:hypothetical protein